MPQISLQIPLVNTLWLWWKRQVAPVARKELIHLLNDSATLRLAVMLPVMQLIIFGFAVNFEISHIPTVVLNEDARPASTQLLNAFTNTTYFDIRHQVFSKDAVLTAIRKGDAKVGIVIGPHYSDDILAGKKAQFQVLIDGSDSNTANQSMSAASQLGNVLSQKQQALKPQPRVSGSPAATIEAVPHLLYNPDLKTTFLVIPALLAIVLLMVTMMLSTFAIVKEIEQGTMDQLLVTPLRPAGLMVGKILPYVVLGLIDFNFVLLIMVTVFAVPIRGSLWLLELSALVFLMPVLGLGLMVSSFASTQAQAGQIAQMSALPSILLSGYVFQIQSEPPIIQAISYCLPATYFIEILRGVIVRGATIGEVLRPLLILSLISFGLLAISIGVFQKKRSLA